MCLGKVFSNSHSSPILFGACNCRGMTHMWPYWTLSQERILFIYHFTVARWGKSRSGTVCVYSVGKMLLREDLCCFTEKSSRHSAQINLRMHMNIHHRSHTAATQGEQSFKGAINMQMYGCPFRSNLVLKILCVCVCARVCELNENQTESWSCRIYGLNTAIFYSGPLSLCICDTMSYPIMSLCLLEH